MKKQILSFLSAALLLAGAQSATAQTKVDASEVFANECFAFAASSNSTVGKSGETITVNAPFKYYGWFNETWASVDLSAYSKLTAVITNYKGSEAKGITLGANLFKTADAIDGDNIFKETRNIDSNGNVTIELDLETEAPYRAKVCYVYLMNWEKCSYTVKEFSLTRKPTSALPSIDADQVVETTYFSLTGMRSATPFKGVNIVRQTLKDGSVKSFKMFSK